MRKFDLSLRSSRSSYFATFRHQLTILSKTDALDEEKWLNMLGTFVKDWFRYESHFVHGRDSLVDILKERGLLSESDAVQPLCKIRGLMVTVCPSQFATRRTLFHVLVGCGLLMLKVSRLKLPVIWLLVSMWLNTLTKSQIWTLLLKV